MNNNDSSLFLCNALERIEDLKEFNNVDLILNVLLKEIYHYNNKSWNDDLHSVILLLIEYSVIKLRKIDIDIETYYDILYPLSRNDIFEEFLNKIISTINTKTMNKISYIKYTIFEKDVLNVFLNIIISKEPVNVDHLKYMMKSIYNLSLKREDKYMFNTFLLKYIKKDIIDDNTFYKLQMDCSITFKNSMGIINSYKHIKEPIHISNNNNKYIDPLLNNEKNILKLQEEDKKYLFTEDREYTLDEIKNMGIDSIQDLIDIIKCNKKTTIKIDHKTQTVKFFPRNKQKNNIVDNNIYKNKKVILHNLVNNYVNIKKMLKTIHSEVDPEFIQIQYEKLEQIKKDKEKNIQELELKQKEEKEIKDLRKQVYTNVKISNKDKQKLEGIEKNQEIINYAQKILNKNIHDESLKKIKKWNNLTLYSKIVNRLNMSKINEDNNFIKSDEIIINIKQFHLQKWKIMKDKKDELTKIVDHIKQLI